MDPPRTPFLTTLWAMIAFLSPTLACKLLLPFFHRGHPAPRAKLCFLSLRWGSPENPMKSAYLVVQGYANFCKMVSMVIIHVPRFRELLVLDPESRDVSNCHPYQFLEICIPLCNNPIGLIQKGHLKHVKGEHSTVYRL